MRRDMPMNQRIDRIGELLAKAVYLCVKKEQEKKENNKNKADKHDEEVPT